MMVGHLQVKAPRHFYCDIPGTDERKPDDRHTHPVSPLYGSTAAAVVGDETRPRRGTGEPSHHNSNREGRVRVRSLRGVSRGERNS